MRFPFIPLSLYNCTFPGVGKEFANFTDHGQLAFTHQFYPTIGFFKKMQMSWCFPWGIVSHQIDSYITYC